MKDKDKERQKNEQRRENRDTEQEINRRIKRGATADCGVARWFVFKPKIPFWVNFGGSCYGKSWYIL
jgi:hypothetical protein